MSNTNPVPIPLGGHLVLSNDHCPKIEKESKKKEKENVHYDVVVGSIMYMLCSCPDFAFDVSVLNRFMSNPGGKHWFAIK